MGDEWTRQSLLSLAGCGLLYASRQLGEVLDADETRGWFFDLAAAACRAYLEESGLWERYVDNFNGPRRESNNPSSAEESQPRDSGEGQLDSGEGQLDIDVTQPYSMTEPNEVTGARILKFPPLPMRGVDSAAQGAGQLQKYDQGQWEGLADALRQVIFDASSWLALTASTDTLLQRLRQTKATLLPSDEDIDHNLQLLEQTLAQALRPSISPMELRAACSRAEILRSAILDLLAEPRK